jgi:hypothetical protein
VKVTVRRSVTVGRLREEIAAQYGSERALRARVRRSPGDFAAKVALHDLREYATDDPAKVLHEERHVVIPDRALDQLTVQRLQLLLALKGLSGEAPGVRALARALGRDVKNVSEDVRALHGLGLLDVVAQGPGRPSRIALPGDSIDLHLVEAGG